MFWCLRPAGASVFTKRANVNGSGPFRKGAFFLGRNAWSVAERSQVAGHLWLNPARRPLVAGRSTKGVRSGVCLFPLVIIICAPRQLLSRDRMAGSDRIDGTSFRVAPGYRGMLPPFIAILATSHRLAGESASEAALSRNRRSVAPGPAAAYASLRQARFRRPGDRTPPLYLDRGSCEKQLTEAQDDG